jgi:hypothetical protein
VPNLNPLSQALGANVVLVNAGVWYNITSLFLNAGTWLLQAHITFVSNHNADILYGCRISDGASAHYASAQTFAHSKSPNTQTLSLCALVTIGVAATIRVQGITNVSGSVVSVVSQTPEYPVGNNATILTAIRVG